MPSSLDPDRTIAEGGDDVASDEIVMFFLGPDGEPLEPAEEPPARTLADVYRSWRAALEAEREHEEYRRTRPVARQVQGTGRPGKVGYRDEIVVTLRSDPMRAVTEAVDGDVFEPPIRHLEVDPESMVSSRYELNWTASIRVGLGRRRPARLRLYASPSLNVTVMSLFPLKQRPIAKASFLRRGLKVMNALRDRIDDRVDATGGP